MLTRYPADYLRFKLLPSSDKFVVTPVGVFFKGLLWEPPEGQKKQWLLPATRSTYPVAATFHRNLVDVIYVHDKKDPTKWTTMHLSDRCSDHAGKSFAEVEAVEEARLTLAELADEHNLRLEIQHDEEAIAREKQARAQVKAALDNAAGRSRTNGAAERRAVAVKKARAKTKVLATTADAPPAPAPAVRPVQTQAAVPVGPDASPPVSSSTTGANAALQALLNLKKKP